MRRLLIVGCGDVIRRVLPDLVRHWRVLALVRQHDPLLRTLGVTQIKGDLDRRADLRRLAGIAHAVIHSAPPDSNEAHDENIDQRTANLIAALQRGRSRPRCVVYISTSGVYGDRDGARVDETCTLNATSARAKRRVDAERRLRALGRQTSKDGVNCRVSLLRAPGIYAADRLPLDRLRRQVPLLQAGEDSRTNHIHALDLGRACIAALYRGRPNRAYNVSDNSFLTMGEWFDALADAYSLPRGPRRTRAEIQSMVSPLQWSFMRESRQLDNTRLITELKLHLRYPTVFDGMGSSGGERPCSG